MPGEPKEPDLDYLARYFDGMLRMMMNAGRDWTGDATPTDSSEGNRPQTPFSLQNAANFMARASQLWMDSSIRFWGRSAEINSNYYKAASRNLSDMNSDPDQREQAEGTLMDLLRAYVREMADLPAQESRRLQAELEKFVENISSPVDEDSTGTHRRGHRVKD